MSATATDGLQDYDLEGEGRKKPGAGAAKGKKKNPAPPKKKPAQETTDEMDDTDENNDDDSTDGSDDNDDDDNVDKVNTDAQDPNAQDAPDGRAPNIRAKDGRLTVGDGGSAVKYAIVDLDEDGLAKFFNSHVDKFMNDELCKGVYDVAALGQLITQLKYMADGAAMERQVEGDTSTIPEALREEAAKLLGILSDMAAEESEEISSGTTMEDVLQESQPTMSPGLYRRDVSEFAKALRGALFKIEGDDESLEKVGRRNSAKDLETLQKCHDALCELGAACAPPSPHENDGESVKPEETTKMSKVSKTDTVMAEGNKRGAAVSDPKPGQQSTNADDAEDTSDQGQEKPQNDTKKGKKRMDMDEAQKKKARMDMDDDMDDDEDEDEDEDFPPPKAKKKAKKYFDADDLAKAVAAGVAAALGGVMNKGDTTMNIRNAPHLMSVGKDGGMAKFQAVDLDALKKSVQAHPKDVDGGLKQLGDNGTATLIKAIHANPQQFRINPSEIPS